MDSQASKGTRRGKLAAAGFIVAAAVAAFVLGLGGGEATAATSGWGGGGGFGGGGVVIEPIGGDDCKDAYSCDQCFRVLRAGYRFCGYNPTTNCFEPNGVCVCIGKRCTDNPFQGWF